MTFNVIFVPPVFLYNRGSFCPVARWLLFHTLYFPVACAAKYFLFVIHKYNFSPESSYCLIRSGCASNYEIISDFLRKGILFAGQRASSSYFWYVLSKCYFASLFNRLYPHLDLETGADPRIDQGGHMPPLNS